MELRYRLFVSLLICVSLSCAASPSLEEGFRSPPHEAKPKVWMHSMSGNMSREGLTKDLEAIAEAGIGGVLLFHVTHMIPKGNVIFNTPEHLELVGHAAAECERLGLSFGVHNCDGWTSSGGPWVSPKHSMKMLVWSEAIVDGGEVEIRLPQPTAREGYYEEVATIAYPTLASEWVDETHRPVLTASIARSMLNWPQMDVGTNRACCLPHPMGKAGFSFPMKCLRRCSRCTLASPKR